MVRFVFPAEYHPPCRSFLVTALQTQIELRMNDGFGAQCTVEDWDEAKED